MFAETDNTEVGGRAMSPWDTLVSVSPTPSSPSPSPPQSVSFPKLVPEVEFGNVEYKLQLLSPSPSRFARLVTQLKWRLLEGNGQAYYELGVADSGLLLGLCQADMDQTLMTLEEMAGEIGASVIVIKEVPVPQGMLAIEDDAKGDWDHRRRHTRRRRRRDNAYALLSAEESTATEDDIPPHHDFKDDPLDSDLSLFSMEPEPEYESESDPDAPTSSPPEFSVDLQISSVYKPRPIRKRVQVTLKGKSKKEKDKGALLAGPSTAELHSIPAQPSHEGLQRQQTKQEAKALHRRAARDRRRDSKKQHQTINDNGTELFTSPQLLSNAEVVSALENVASSLHPQAEVLTVAHPEDVLTPTDEDVLSPVVSTSLTSPAEANEEEDDDDDVFPPTLNPQKRIYEDSEKRIIVEALVVRKMSVDEAFLDFGGFALEL